MQFKAMLVTRAGSSSKISKVLSMVEKEATIRNRSSEKYGSKVIEGTKPRSSLIFYEYQLRNNQEDNSSSRTVRNKQTIHPDLHVACSIIKIDSEKNRQIIETNYMMIEYLDKF